MDENDFDDDRFVDENVNLKILKLSKKKIIIIINRVSIIARLLKFQITKK